MKKPDPSLIYSLDTTPFEGKAKTRKELASELGMSVSTLYRKLNETGFTGKTGLLSPKEQLKIKKLLGYIS